MQIDDVECSICKCCGFDIGELQNNICPDCLETIPLLRKFGIDITDKNHYYRIYLAEFDKKHEGKFVVVKLKNDAKFSTKRRKVRKEWKKKYNEFLVSGDTYCPLFDLGTDFLESLLNLENP